MWVLTIGVLEVYPHWHTIRAQRGRARSALFSRVKIIGQKPFPSEVVFFTSIVQCHLTDSNQFELLMSASVVKVDEASIPLLLAIE